MTPCPHCSADLVTTGRRHCPDRRCAWTICRACASRINLATGRHCCGRDECKAVAR